jgi:hypothetical protein
MTAEKWTGALAGVLVAACMLAASCGKDASPENPAYLDILLTDTAGVYDSVVVDVQSVEIKPGQGASVTRPALPGLLNLPDLANGRDTLLAAGEVPAGHISQVRLILGSNNYVVIGGTRYPLTTPSAQQSGLKLNIDAAFLPGVQYTLLLDFDAARSVVATGSGSYMLKPVIRTVSLATSGSISGSVSPAAALPATAMACSPGDTLATVTDSSGNFLIRGVPSGSWTVIVIPSTPYIADTLQNVSVVTGLVTDVGQINF